MAAARAPASALLSSLGTAGRSSHIGTPGGCWEKGEASSRAPLGKAAPSKGKGMGTGWDETRRDEAPLRRAEGQHRGPLRPNPRERPPPAPARSLIGSRFSASSWLANNSPPRALSSLLLAPASRPTPARQPPGRCFSVPSARRWRRQAKVAAPSRGRPPCPEAPATPPSSAAPQRGPWNATAASYPRRTATTKGKTPPLGRWRARCGGVLAAWFCCNCLQWGLGGGCVASSHKWGLCRYLFASPELMQKSGENLLHELLTQTHQWYDSLWPAFFLFLPSAVTCSIRNYRSSWKSPASCLKKFNLYETYN